jgi:hypothetical protein
LVMWCLKKLFSLIISGRWAGSEFGSDDPNP